MKWGIVFSLALMALCLASSVSAGSYEILRVEHIRMPDYSVSGYYPIRVEVANEQVTAAEDVHVRTLMPWFSDRSSGMINELLGWNSGKTLLQAVPKGTAPAEYWVRITVSNDDERRVKHRLVTVI